MVSAIEARIADTMNKLQSNLICRTKKLPAKKKSRFLRQAENRRSPVFLRDTETGGSMALCPAPFFPGRQTFEHADRTAAFQTVMFHAQGGIFRRLRTEKPFLQTRLQTQQC